MEVRASSNRELYIKAIHAQDTTAVSELLGKQVSANIRIDKDFNSGLHYAVKKKDLSLIKLLCCYHADYSVRNRIGQSPLDIAIENGDWNSIQAIGEFQTDQEASIKFNSAVELAIQKQGTTINSDKKPKLSNSNAVMDEKDIQKEYPSTVSGTEANVTAMEVDPKPLVKPPEINPRKKFIDAVLSGSLSEVESCLANRVSPNIRIDHELNTALHHAFKHKNSALSQLLILNHADHGAINRRKETPVTIAIQDNWWEGIQLLSQLKKLKDDAQLGYALLSAIQDEKYERIPVLLQAGASANAVTEEGYNCLHIAVSKNKPELIEELLKHCQDTEQENRQGYTPFTLAIIENKFDCAARLISNAHGQYNVILSQAVYKNDTALVAGLLQIGALPTTVGILVSPIKNHNLQVVEMLLNAGANLTTFGDFSAIEFAASCNDWEMVNLIATLRRTDFSDISNYDGVLLSAIEANQIEVVQQLIKAGSPLHCFQLDKGEECLKKLAANIEANQQIINILLAAPKHNEVQKILFKYFKNLPEYISDYFEDPILTGEFVNPMITPQGTTYSYDSISKVHSDPITRAPLHHQDLLKNELAEDLMQFYKDPKTETDTIPLMLFCPETKKFYKDPVVAVDGKTYEKQTLMQYWTKNPNNLPSGMRDTSHRVYPNHLIVDLIREKYLLSLLAKAVKENNFPALNEILEYDHTLIQAKIDAHKNTILHYCIEHHLDNVELFDYLLYSKADIFAENKNGISPVNLLIQKNRWDLIQRYIEFKKGAKETGFSSLILQIILHNQIQLFPLAIKSVNEFKARVKETGNTCLHLAALKNDPGLVKLLLEHGHDVALINKAGHSALDVAVLNGSYESAAVLLSSLHTSFEELLLYAVKSKQNDLVIALLKTGTSLLCFMTIKGTEYLKELMQSSDDNKNMIDALLQAGKTQPPAVCSHIELILSNPEQMLSELPDDINEMFEDSLDFMDIVNPIITPEGKTYSEHTISKLQTDPETREPLQDKLIPNLLVTDLLNYYRIQGIDLMKMPPVLICPETNKPYEQPVVALDGRTYEKEYLEDYLRHNNQKLPDGTLQDRKPYINRIVTSLINEKFKNEAGNYNINSNSIGLFSFFRPPSENTMQSDLIKSETIQRRLN